MAITGVRVFDGERVTAARTVVLRDGLISAEDAPPEGAALVDGTDQVLLPGLIDAHVHVQGPEALDRSAEHGVTTVLDMASRPPALIASLRGRAGTADLRSAGSPASAPGGLQTTLMGFDPSAALTGPHDAEPFVAERAAEGSDYIKVIVEDPDTRSAIALDGETVAALVDAAHRRGLRVFAHATTRGAYRLAAGAGVDVLTHAPVDADVDDDLVALVRAKGIVVVPTLTMMKVVTQLGRTPDEAGAAYAHAQACVGALHRAGVPIIAGTDANAAPSAPARVAHGSGLHDELALLVDAGLSPVEALRAATVLPARLFNLCDRGTVEPERRADLVLVGADPTLDISATADIRGAWAGGRRVQ